MGSYMKFGSVVQEEMPFNKKFMDTRQTKPIHKSSPCAFGSGELKTSVSQVTFLKNR